MIARMWETRLRDGLLDEFCQWVRDEVWPQFLTTDGFSGGEVYRSDVDNRVVVVTQWLDDEALLVGYDWFDLGAERFSARAPDAWEFTQVETATQVSH